MTGFCLKKGQGLKALAAHLHPNCLQVTPHPPLQGGGIDAVKHRATNSKVNLAHRSNE